MTKEDESVRGAFHLTRSLTGATVFLSQREGFLDINYGVGVLAQGREQSFVLPPPFNSI